MKKTRIIGGLMALLMATSTATGIAVSNSEKTSQQMTAYAVEEIRNPSGEWVQFGTKWKYKRTVMINGKKHKYYVNSAWILDGGLWYFLGVDGYMYVGAHKIEGKEYYFDFGTGNMPKGAMRANWWRQVGKRWCYYGADGAKCFNTWVKGAKKVNGKDVWYYIGGDGYMITSGWVDLPEGNQIIRYYFDAKGVYVNKKVVKQS